MRQSTQIDALIAVAKKLEREGATERAEQLYRQAVNTSEFLYGAASPRTGLVILELMDFCESHDNESEAHKLWTRLRGILLN